MYELLFKRYNTEKLIKMHDTLSKSIDKIKNDTSTIKRLEREAKQINKDMSKKNCIEEAKEIMNNRLVQIKSELEKEPQERGVKIEEINSKIKAIKEILDSRQTKDNIKEEKCKTLKRKEIVEDILRSEIFLNEKYDQLVDILPKKELFRLQMRIEEIEDNRINLLDDDPKNIERGLDSKWRTLYYQKDKYVDQLRMILCSKLVHVLWEHGSFKDSLKIIREMGMTQEDSEGCLNYKTTKFIYKGVPYILFPEMPSILEKAFDVNTYLFHKWNTFHKLFNVHNVDCTDKHDKCQSEQICTSYSEMFDQLYRNFIRIQIYFPKYHDICGF